MFDETNKVHRRARQALDAAISVARGATGPDVWNIVLSRLKEIELHFGARDGQVYADGSHTEHDIVAVGNWNDVAARGNIARKSRQVEHGDLPVRLSNVFEKLGIECVWSDQHTTCCDCGLLLRTDPDSYKWEPFYHETDEGYLCYNCEPEHKFPDTIAWLAKHDACKPGKAFVGKDRTLAEAVMDKNTSDAHLQWVWDELNLEDEYGFERTRELLRDACEREGI